MIRNLLGWLGGLACKSAQPLVVRWWALCCRKVCADIWG